MKIFYFTSLVVLMLLPASRALAQESSRTSRTMYTPPGRNQMMKSAFVDTSAASMNFDALPDFALTFGSWMAVDVDHKPTFTIQGHIFPHNGDTMSFISFNPASVVPSMASDPDIQPHSGTQFGACFSATTPSNNDWFISPKIRLKKDGTFSFWVKSYTSTYGLEKYKVGVSVTDSNPSSFTIISGALPLNAAVTWEKKTFSLSAYNSKDVYVAIQCVSDTAFIFMIDDLYVDPGTDSSALPSTITQNFELLPDFTLAFDPWKTIDVRGGDTWSLQNCTFPNAGMPMAWINFVPSLASPPPLNMVPHSGLKLAECFSSMPPDNPNDKWLISPRMHLGIDGKLTLWAMTYNTAYGLEKYNICVSTTGSNPSDFTVIKEGELAPMDWTEKNYDLSAYAGQDVYIGIECISDNQFILMVDDITISSTVGLEDHPIADGMTLYPNPASDRIVLGFTFSPGHHASVSLVNILGREVRSFPGMNLEHGQAVLDLSGLTGGAYILVYTDENRKAVSKLVIN